MAVKIKGLTVQSSIKQATLRGVTVVGNPQTNIVRGITVVGKLPSGHGQIIRKK